MTEQECLNRMISPGQSRTTKWMQGVIQIHVTRACDLACLNCTQGSNYGGKTYFMPPDMFEQAVLSLRGYFGVFGVFGGNPALSPHFQAYCEILKKHVPFEQRGLWCNHPRGKGKYMRGVFNPAVSNLNCHLSKEAYDEFKRDWPESMPFGLDKDSRHSPVYVAMKDVVRKECISCDGEGSLMYQWAKKRCVETNGRRVDLTGDRAHEGFYYVTGDGREIEFKTIGGPCQVCMGAKTVPDESRIYELISTCDINKFWSAMIGMFRGELRAWFCEIAGAQAMLHQDESDYPDTGVDLSERTRCMQEMLPWWQLPMVAFAVQVKKHCFDCGVPLRGYGELAQSKTGKEQFSATHESVCKSKKPDRQMELVTDLQQLGVGRLSKTTDYMGNAKR